MKSINDGQMNNLEGLPSDPDNKEMKEIEKNVGKINWVKPEERYIDKGEYIGPNTYRSGKMN